MTKPQAGQNSKMSHAPRLIPAPGRGRAVQFRVELVWQADEAGEAEKASSIYLTSDGRVILQGAAVPRAEREALALPLEAEMISVDRRLIRAIKDML
jgi:hypothetical protein